MPGPGSKCLPPVGTVEYTDVPGITGIGVTSALCLGPDHRVWVGCGGVASNPVAVFDPLDKSVVKHTPAGISGFQGLGGLTTDGQFIYIGNTTAGKIYKMALDGSTVSDSGDLGVSGIAGVIWHPVDEQIYAVVSVGVSRILTMDTDWTNQVLHTTPLGQGGHGLNLGPNPALNGAPCMWFGQGQIPYYVSALDINGVFTQFPVAYKPFYTNAGGDGRSIWFTSQTDGYYGRILLPQGQTDYWLCPGGPTSSPSGLCSDFHGSMWLCEMGTDQIVRISESDPSSRDAYSLTAGSGPDKIIPGLMDGVMVFPAHDAGRIATVQS